ncbi:MAG: class I SAM-dependent methyltransferase [Solirubrobacteraceae bacterium MAG38_C4-C5]|nr:class I SAM-dependent methyltransferase [Candidatus Siliceabacter maunaloa]
MHEQAGKAPPAWYDGFFESEWLDYLALGRPEQTRQQAEFIVEKLALEPGAAILDLACGRGRVAVELARLGFGVTGLDLSPRSLELPRETAHDAGLDIQFVRRDMRQLDAEEAFDAVINVWTSFGYFEREEDHGLVLDTVARALVPGGRFLIDTINPMAVARRFQERDWREFDDGTIMLEQRSYDHLTGSTGATWTFVRTDGSRTELRHVLRAYTAAELVALLERAGLHVEGAWGGFKDVALGEGPRTILLARK